MQSVAEQTIPVQQVFARDRVLGGSGVAGMFSQVKLHAHRLTGDYVHFLADDDWLCGPTVAEQVQTFALLNGWPDVIVVRAEKCGVMYPIRMEGPPICGQIDLGCIITRRDVWLQHVQDYAAVYEGDYWHMLAMYNAGRRFVYSSIEFERGPAMRGAAE